MKKFKPFVVKDPVYESVTWVIAGWTAAELTKWVNKKWVSAGLQVEAVDQMLGSTIVMTSGEIVLWLRYWDGCARCHSTLAHEATHVALAMAERTKVDASAQEPMAYYQGFLVQGILQGLGLPLKNHHYH